MKPTEQQDLLLRKYLNKTLDYRETYEEVYDHISTALENKPQTNDFFEAVTQIIRDDFGGAKQMVKFELATKKILSKATFRKFLKYYGNYFSTPVLFITLIFILIIYYLITRINIPVMVCELTMLTVVIILGTLRLKRYYTIGYRYRNTKKSLNDDTFSFVTSIPTRVFVMINLLSIGKIHFLWQQFSAFITTGVIVLTVIYGLALYKLYVDEFNMNAIS